MTSSLVGSEMCIRDSSSSLSGSCPFMVSRRASPLLVRVLLTGMDDSSAVSYTHLTLPTICSV
eukprot:2599345-Prorocentrum_lima.AAC.1